MNSKVYLIWFQQRQLFPHYLFFIGNMAESELFSFLYLWKKWKKFVLPFAIFLVQNESTAQTRARPTLEFCSRLCFVHYFDSWPKLIIPLITRVEGEGGLSPKQPITTTVSLVPGPIIGCTWQDTTYNISIIINVSTHPLYNHNQRHTNKHSFKLWAMQSTAHVAPSPHISKQGITLLLLMP